MVTFSHKWQKQHIFEPVTTREPSQNLIYLMNEIKLVDRFVLYTANFGIYQVFVTVHTFQERNHHLIKWEYNFRIASFFVTQVIAIIGNQTYRFVIVVFYHVVKRINMEPLYQNFYNLDNSFNLIGVSLVIVEPQFVEVFLYQKYVCIWVVTQQVQPVFVDLHSNHRHRRIRSLHLVGTTNYRYFFFTE